jgi:hypothetical protein
MGLASAKIKPKIFSSEDEMSNTIKALKLFYLILAGLLTYYTYVIVGNTFGAVYMSDFYIEDAIGTMSMYTALVLLSHTLFIPLSVLTAIYNDGFTWHGVLWAVAFAGANLLAAFVWIAMDYWFVVSAQFAVLFFGVISLMNLCNSLSFIVGQKRQ